MKSKLLIGIEIEGIFNADYFKPKKIGNYHEPVRVNKYYRVEHDGSLRRSFNFPREVVAEITTPPIQTKKTFVNTIKGFKGLFKNAERKELNELVYFNDSCGCHIHIGFIDGNGKQKKISRLLDEDRVLKFRRKFFKALRELDIDDETKEQIRKQYFRGYASRCDKRNYFDRRRRKEFNLTSDEEDTGFEWRSFNLHGVKTFEDFEKIFLMIYDLIKQNFYDRMNRGYKTKKRVLTLKNYEENETQREIINLRLDDEPQTNIILNVRRDY